MNTIKIKNLVALSMMIVFFISCNEDKDYEKEMYKKTVCLLSGDDQTFTETYGLDDPESIRYFSIICGGSLLNDEPIIVTLETDTILLDHYNKYTFDDDSASFAKVLPESWYEISSYTISLPANPVDQYEKVPVKVRPEGLSPDTIYFIPLAIKNVSGCEVNKDKYNLLYRVAIANNYAKQVPVTNYTKKSTETNLTSGSKTILSRPHIVQPLTKDRVRMFAGSNSHKLESPTLFNDIEKFSIIVQINADNTLTIMPYRTIEVEQLSLPEYNIYTVEEEDGRTSKVFYMYYKYRTLTTPATETEPAVWSGWYEVKESLRFYEQ